MFQFLLFHCSFSIFGCLFYFVTASFFLYNKKEVNKMDHHLEIVKTNVKYPIVFYNHQFNKSRPVSSHYHQDCRFRKSRSMY